MKVADIDIKYICNALGRHRREIEHLKKEVKRLESIKRIYVDSKKKKTTR